MKKIKNIRPVINIFLSKRMVFLLTLGVITGLTACKQEEGFGGTSSVSGKVYVLDYNTELTDLMGQYYATDEDVFIMFGDDVVYADKTSTSFDGTYRFDNLKRHLRYMRIQRIQPGIQMLMNLPCSSLLKLLQTGRMLFYPTSPL